MGRTYAPVMRPPRLAAILAGAVALTLLSAIPAATADEVDPPGSISGTVGPFDANAEVVLERVDSPGKRYAYSDGTTYTFDDVQPGRYRVAFFARSSGYAWEYFPGVARASEARVVTVKAGQAVTGVDAELERAGGISGTVSFTSTSSLLNRPPRMVPYYLDGDAWVPVPSYVTDGTISTPPFEGADSPAQYRLGNLPAGSYRLRYTTTVGHAGTASGFLGGTDEAASSTPVEVSTDRVTTVDMTPRRGGTVRGRVVDSAGRPLAGVGVEAYSRVADTWVFRSNRVITDPAGRYEIFPLDSEDYYLEIQPPDGYDESYSGGVQRDHRIPYNRPSIPADATPVRAFATRVVEAPDEVVQEMGRLDGTVRDQIDARGVPGLRVTAQRLTLVEGGGRIRLDHGLTTSTDDEGRYSFGQLAQGHYKVTVADPQGLYNPETYQGEGSTLLLASDYWSGFTRVVSERSTVADLQTAAPEPSMSDETPVVGQTVRAQAPESVASPDPTWVWRRNGTVVAGRDGASYSVGTADRGARLTAEVVGDRAGRGVVHRSAPTSSVSTVRPSISVTARSTRRGRVVLTIRAKAAGVPTRLVDGRIEVGRVRKGSDRLTTRSMRDGVLTVTLTKQPRGKRTYTARFLASPNRFATSATGRRAISVR